MTEKTVTIPKQEYDRLEKDSQWLACLEMAGVDNWDGIEEAMRMFRVLRSEIGE